MLYFVRAANKTKIHRIYKRKKFIMRKRGRTNAWYPLRNINAVNKLQTRQVKSLPAIEKRKKLSKYRKVSCKMNYISIALKWVTNYMQVAIIIVRLENVNANMNVE